MADATATTDADAARQLALVCAAQAGDRAAFDALARTFYRRARAVSFRLLGDADDAAEVVQDALLKAWTSLPGLDAPGAFGGWLMRIVSNLSLNKRRGRALRRHASLDAADEADDRPHAPADDRPGPQREASGHELGAALKDALAELPEKQRQALLLFAVDGLPQKEVADALGLSVEAVKWHVFQARKKLRGKLDAT